METRSPGVSPERLMRHVNAQNCPVDLAIVMMASGIRARVSGITPGPAPKRSTCPRVGGGDTFQLHVCTTYPGRSPRGRGKLNRSSRLARDNGPSPRVRGKRGSITPFQQVLGSIPASAGERSCARRSYPVRGVDPRACGGSQGNYGSHALRYGRSPRLRGKRQLSTESPLGARSIPTRAGETGTDKQVHFSAPVHPRVGGGDRTSRCFVPGASRVDPRACGGNQLDGTRNSMTLGPSPRVRGKRLVGDHRHSRPGSIPARAGETLRTSAELDC